MTDWSGLGVGNQATEVNNWVGGIPPGPLDSAHFPGGSGKFCNWDIVSPVGLVSSDLGNMDPVFQQTKLTCAGVNWASGPVGEWVRQGNEIEFSGAFNVQVGPMSYSGGEIDRCASADPFSSYLGNGGYPFSTLRVEKSAGTFSLQGNAAGGAIILDVTNGNFEFFLEAGSSGAVNTFQTLGPVASLNLVTVATSLPGTQATLSVVSAGPANQFASFQDIVIAGIGAPITADDSCTDLLNNVNIVFSGAAPCVADTHPIRAALLEMCRTAKVANAAEVDEVEWAVTSGRIRVMAEETPGIPNRGRLPMVQILFAGWARLPVINGGGGGGQSNMLWTIRVHTGGVANQAQQEKSECISQACIEQIRAPVVDPDAFPVEGTDDMGIHEIRAAWHVQDTTIAVDANYCIPFAP